MSFLRNAVGADDEPEKSHSMKLYDGKWDKADQRVSIGIKNLMEFAMNQRGPNGRTFQTAGDQMVFQMNDVTLGVKGDAEDEDIPAGDFEIIIRRVR